MMAQQLGREARDIGGLAAHLRDQPFHRDARWLIELRLRRERRRRVLGDARRVPIDLRAVVERLRTARLAQRPLRFAAGRRAACGQAEAARDEVLVQQCESRGSGSGCAASPSPPPDRARSAPPPRCSRSASAPAGAAGSPARALVGEQRQAEQRQHRRQHVDVTIVQARTQRSTKGAKPTPAGIFVARVTVVTLRSAAARRSSPWRGP